MQVSNKGRYALQLMLDLASRKPDQYVSVRSVAQRQQLPEKYLEQIIRTLCKAGYVKSARGASGGYRLSQPPENYTVGMILSLTEGSLSSGWDFSGNGGALTELWKALDRAIEHLLDQITLADLAARDRGQGAPLEIPNMPFRKEFFP